MYLEVFNYMLEPYADHYVITRENMRQNSIALLQR